MPHIDLRYLAVTAAFGFGASASVEAASRTWEFDLKTPARYELHVQYDFQAAAIPRGAVATYTIEAEEKTVKRDAPFYSTDNSHLIFALGLDVLRPQKAKVTIAGIPKPFLDEAKVYLIDGNTRYPFEWFDPGKGVELNSAKRIRAILRQPEQRIDLARAKLTIDQQMDPSIDIEANLQKIDAMAVGIKSLPEYGPTNARKAEALRRYIYEPGTWNGFKPHQYDMNDPLGFSIPNKRLSHYLAVKKGNCVTMPFLFVILGERVGLDITAATAPMHVLAKVKDDATGAWYNVETTSGGYPARDIWYREHMPMTDQAIENGVYMQPLTKKETVALMATTLMEHYFAEGEFEKAVTIADLVLEYYPKLVSAMIYKSNAYYELSAKYYLKKYRSPQEIPPPARGHYMYLLQNNHRWGEKAKSLGWRQPSKADEEKYLQQVSQDRRNQTRN